MATSADARRIRKGALASQHSHRVGQQGHRDTSRARAPPMATEGIATRKLGALGESPPEHARPIAYGRSGVGAGSDSTDFAHFGKVEQRGGFPAQNSRGGYVAISRKDGQLPTIFRRVGHPPTWRPVASRWRYFGLTSERQASKTTYLVRLRNRRSTSHPRDNAGRSLAAERAPYTTRWEFTAKFGTGET